MCYLLDIFEYVHALLHFLVPQKMICSPSAFFNKQGNSTFLKNSGRSYDELVTFCTVCPPFISTASAIK